MSYEDVKGAEQTIRELCKTNLPTVKICRFLERDGVALGHVGKMQAREKVYVTVYQVYIIAKLRWTRWDHSVTAMCW